MPAHSPARLGNPASRLQVSLVEQPQFGFELTLYGGDITLLPGLEAWLTAVIRDAVLGPFVLPGRFTFPLSPAATSASPLPRGMLFVTAVGARGLPRMDLFSKTDAYVRQETGVGGGEQGWEGARCAGGLRAVAGGGGLPAPRPTRPFSPQPPRPRTPLPPPPPPPHPTSCSLSVRAARWSRTRTVPNDDDPDWGQEFRFVVHEPDYQAHVCDEGGWEWSGRAGGRWDRAFTCSGSPPPSAPLSLAGVDVRGNGFRPL